MKKSSYVGLQFAITLLLSIILFASRAHSAEIAGLYITGAGGTNGQVDLHYVLVETPLYGVATPIISSIVPTSWLVPVHGAWLGLADNANAGMPEGDYVYRMTFDLVDQQGRALNTGTALIHGVFAVDDLFSIRFNGKPVSIDEDTPGTGFGVLRSFTIASGFLSSANNLDIIVHNLGPSTNPTGLLVEELFGTADYAPSIAAPVPEPATLLLLVISPVIWAMLTFVRGRFGFKAIPLRPVSGRRQRR